MATTGNSFSWEISKENTAPLARGRRIEHLEQPEMSTLEKAEAIIRFERRILEEAASDKPLSAWIDYIKWHEDNFPSQVHDQFHLIERCFQTFQTDHRFFHDIRYIRVCCLYADKTQEPTQTFQELYLTGIGRTSAIFWNAWAFVAEKSGNFRLADRVYRQAIEERAEPMAYLLQRKTHFQKRMAKHFLESLTAPENIEEEEEEQQRTVFESVYVDSGPSRPVRMGSSTTFTDRSIQSEVFKTSRQKDPPNVSQAPLAIYNEINGGLDDSLFDSRAAVSERESERQRWKENQVPREKWSERTHGPSLPIVKTNAFSIHVDEQCVAENARKEEKLLQKDQEHRLNRRGIASAEGDRDKKRPKPAWKKNLLKDSSGKEQCFEEARVESRCYCLVSSATNFNLIAQKDSEEKAEDSSMSMCSSNDDSAIYDETIVLDKGLLNAVQTNANLPDNSDPYSPKAYIKIPETSWSSIISARLPPPPPPTANLSSHFPLVLGNMNHNRPEPIALDTSWSSNTGRLQRTTVNMNDNRSEIPANASWSSNASGRLPTPTVNMQFAMDQVSMMFSSPMVGEEIGLNAPAPSMSIRHDSPASERENIFRRRYPDARSLPLAESNVLVNLEQEDDGHRSALGCTRSTNTTTRRIGASRQDDPMAGLQERDLPSNPGFSVYEDSSNGFHDTTIGASNHLVPNPDDGANTSKPLSVGTTGFSVFQDVESSSLEVCTTAGIGVHRSERAFTVHQNPSLTIHHDIAQQNVTDSNDSVKSDDLMLFGGGAEPGEPTMTNNAFDCLNLGTRRIQTTAVRVPLPQFGDISTIEDEDQLPGCPGPRSRN